MKFNTLNKVIISILFLKKNTLIVTNTLLATFSRL
jgi:hypothetical protein